MRVHLSIEYRVEDDNPDLEKLGGEVVRAQADAFAKAVRDKLAGAGAQVTSFRADYE